jgi:hypothetical protein
MIHPVDVRCARDGAGWRCEVIVGDDPGETRHEVAVSAATLASLAPRAADPEALVRASFNFLLVREPRESILRRFDLMVIRRYFPDWEAEVRRRLST